MMENSKLQRYFQFFLVVLAAGAIFPIIYLRTNYQETLLEVFGITLQQLNTIYSVLGIVWVAGYLPSGVISDKFSAKKLLVVSLLGTAAGGFWFARIPGFGGVAVIYLYAVALTIVGILIWIFVKEEGPDKTLRTESEKFRLSDVPRILRNSNLYLHGAIVFFGYAVYWTVYYIGGFLQTNLGAAPVTVGAVTVAILWMRPVGGLAGGWFADKAGKTVTIAVCLGGAAVCLAFMALLPASLAKGLFFALAIVLGIFLYGIRGTYWSILGDNGFENRRMGTAIGAISLFGYLPDILLPQFNSMLVNRFGDEGGYNV